MKRSRQRSADKLKLWSRGIFGGLDAAAGSPTTEEKSKREQQDDDDEQATHRKKFETAIVHEVLGDDDQHVVVPPVVVPDGSTTTQQPQQPIEVIDVDAENSNSVAMMLEMDEKINAKEVLKREAEEARKRAVEETQRNAQEFRDIAPVAEAILEGELGDVVIGLRLHGQYTSFADPARFEYLPNSRSVCYPLQSVEMFILVRNETFYRVSHSTVPAVPYLAALLASTKVRKIVYNTNVLYSFLFAFLGTEKITIHNVCDVSLAAPFLHPVEKCVSFHKLANVAFTDAIQSSSSASESGGWVVASGGRNIKWEMSVCWHMGKRMDDVVLRGPLAAVIQLDIEAEFLCAVMSYHGFIIDQAKWVEGVRTLDDRLQVLVDGIGKAAKAANDKSFDPLGCDVLALENFLLDTMKMKERLSQTDQVSLARGNQPAIDVLAAAGEQLAKDILEAKALLQQREALMQSFNRHAAPNQRACRAQDGKEVQYSVHPTFTVRGIKTGRIFASNPNLQTLAKGSKHGINLRAMYTAPAGCSLLSIDFNQIELRILAHFSQDSNLIALFQEGGDVLRKMGQLVFKKEKEVDVTSVERDATKIIVYGLIYGFGDANMQTRLPEGVQAASIRTAFFTAFPNVARFLDDVKSHAMFRLEAFTLLGRRRALHEAHGDPLKAQRLAVSTIIQGTAAEVLKKSMWAVQEFRLEVAHSSAIPTDESSAKLASSFALCMTVHDELIFAVHTDKVQQVAAKLSEVIIKEVTSKEPFNLRVPLTVACKAGPSLGELVALDQ